MFLPDSIIIIFVIAAVLEVIRICLIQRRKEKRTVDPSIIKLTADCFYCTYGSRCHFNVHTSFALNMDTWTNPFRTTFWSSLFLGFLSKIVRHNPCIC